MPFERHIRDVDHLHDYFVSKNFQAGLKAKALALEYHVNKRKDGAPEFTHQMYIAWHAVHNLIPHVRYKEELLIGILLHDTVEDYYDRISFEDLEHEFNSIVIDMLRPVTKPRGFSKTLEEYEAYYAAIAENRDSILIKAADRIHNLLTMVNVFTLTRQIEYIQEVEDFIIPMLKEARHRYFEYADAYYSVQKTLERQVIYLREIIHRDEEILELRRALADYQQNE